MRNCIRFLLLRLVCALAAVVQSFQAAWLLAAAILLAPMHAGAQPQYTVTDLGWNGSGPGGGAYGAVVNNNGQVAGSGGYNPYSGGVRGFFYSGGVTTDIGSLGGNVTYVYGINNSGQVVGTSTTSSGASHAFLYSGGTITDLSSLIGGSSSSAGGINDTGQIVGSYTASSGANHAFLYSTATGLTDLQAVIGGSRSGASAINNSGQIVGTFTASNGFDHAFLYSGGTVTDLGALIAAGNIHSAAIRINSSGNVLISAGTTSAWGGQTFLYNGSTMTQLSPFPGGWVIYPGGINNSGQVVGETSSASSSCCVSYLYSGGALTDISNAAPGVWAGVAWDINDRGQIVVWGGEEYLLTPIPHPSELYQTPLYSDPSLVSYWRFEGNANDSRGSNNGTASNVSYGTGYGKFGQGAYFNGSATITIPDAPSLDPASAMTMSMWVYPIGTKE